MIRIKWKRRATSADMTRVIRHCKRMGWHLHAQRGGWHIDTRRHAIRRAG